MTHSHLVPALVAGLMEGIVEWLPVSSKTMITLYFSVIGIKVQSAYNLGLIANLGSFFAALYYFRSEAWGVIRALRRPFRDDPYARLLRFLFIGTLATGVIGIPLYITILNTFSIVSGSIAMVIIGVLLLITAFIARRKELMIKAATENAAAGSGASTQGTSAQGASAQGSSVEGASARGPSPANDPVAMGRPVTTLSAVVTGAMQGLAALPGISRSGMTITPLLWMGFSAEESMRLSFMLDVLALLGAGVVPVVIGKGGRAAILQFGWGPTLLMLLVAAVVSFLAINAVLRLAKRLRTSVVTFVIAVITLSAPIAALIRL